MRARVVRLCLPLRHGFLTVLLGLLTLRFILSVLWRDGLCALRIAAVSALAVTVSVATVSAALSPLSLSAHRLIFLFFFHIISS